MIEDSATIPHSGTELIKEIEQLIQRYPDDNGLKETYKVTKYLHSKYGEDLLIEVTVQLELDQSIFIKRWLVDRTNYYAKDEVLTMMRQDKIDDILSDKNNNEE